MVRARHRRKDVRSVGDRDDTAEVEQLRRRIDELEAALGHAEGAVRPSMDGDARLRDILEACPIGIAILDEEDGRRLFANSALVDILGAGSREQVLQGDIATTLALQEPVGRSPDSPLPPGALREKFNDCAGRLLAADKAAALADAVEDLETLDDIRALTMIIGDAEPAEETGAPASLSSAIG